MTIKVLLADDHAVLRDGLKLLLEAEKDITVVGEASNGLEAVKKAKRLHPDVVVMDIAMPELNGLEATKKISKVSSAQVLILSMYSSREHIYQALKAGARGYLLKEIAGNEVVEAVRSVHADQYYLCNKISSAIVKDYLKKNQTRKTSAFSTLTDREREVLQLLTEGKTTKEAAYLLKVSVKTIETHRHKIMDKLNLHSIAELTKYAIREGLTSLEQ
jgi:DNA-binding NarL/FixJ family response regulator